MTASRNSKGDKAADSFAAVVGSWVFIIIQSCALIAWITWNLIFDSFDPYPFILLNLMLSFQAAYTGPILLMSSNRQSKIDRRRAIKNLMIDQKDHEILGNLILHIDKHFHELHAKLDGGKSDG